MEIYNYMLQHVVHVDIANTMRHVTTVTENME